jgi:hypothetical protein
MIPTSWRRRIGGFTDLAAIRGRGDDEEDQ